jgi:hypothetical protein
MQNLESTLIRLTCPKCYEDSYVQKVDIFISCPYCGCTFSGKYGVEKREEKRTDQEIPFTFKYKGQELQASTTNYSNKGIGIEIFGMPSLKQGDVIELTIGDMEIKAMIIWVKMLPDKLLTGLKRLN